MNKHTATASKSVFSWISDLYHSGKQVTIICLLLIFGITINVKVLAQNYRYKFQIEGITDTASAKVITDPLRALFNAPDEPFRFYPAFNGEHNAFDFRSDIDISQSILFGLLSDHGLLLTSFVRYSLETTPQFE